MTDVEVESKVLELLAKETVPVRPTLLYSKLKDMHVDEIQSRRAVVELAVQHKIEVTSNRRVVLRK